MKVREGRKKRKASGNSTSSRSLLLNGHQDPVSFREDAAPGFVVSVVRLLRMWTVTTTKLLITVMKMSKCKPRKSQFKRSTPGTLGWKQLPMHLIRLKWRRPVNRSRCQKRVFWANLILKIRGGSA